MKKVKTNIEYKYRKASHLYEIITSYEAGIMLCGTEVKSIRNVGVNFSDPYCHFVSDELFIKGLIIAEYKYGTYMNHDPYRERKILLHKRELIKLKKAIGEKGLTIIPTKLYINSTGIFKIEIAVCRGKRMVDKREFLKKKDDERRLKEIF